MQFRRIIAFIFSSSSDKLLFVKSRTPNNNGSYFNDLFSLALQKRQRLIQMLIGIQKSVTGKGASSPNGNNHPGGLPALYHPFIPASAIELGRYKSYLFFNTLALEFSYWMLRSSFHLSLSSGFRWVNL